MKMSVVYTKNDAEKPGESVRGAAGIKEAMGTVGGVFEGFGKNMEENLGKMTGMGGKMTGMGGMGGMGGMFTAAAGSRPA